MNGRDSYGVPAGFAGISSLGSSHNRLTSTEDYEEALLSGYPPVGLLDASKIYHAQEKGNRLPRPERRGLHSPWVSAPARSRLSPFRVQRPRKIPHRVFLPV